MRFRASWIKPLTVLFFVATLMPVGIFAPPASGQVAVPEDFPLQPPDTSSPRDTLRNFQSAAERAIVSLLRGEPDQRAIGQAIALMDFSTTVAGNTWDTRVRGVVLLQEILNRITLPDDAGVPDDAQVTAGGVAGWRIPGTAITIARVEEGPRAGEFLVSADSVAQLHRLYRQVRHLPSAPGATAGAYETIFGDDGAMRLHRQTIQDRLRPVDTSNPLATFEGFLDSINRAHALVTGAQAANDLTRDELLAIERTVDNLLQRAALTLDLSEIPDALRADFGIESALQLKEIFDRMPLPPLDAIPDAQVVEAARRGEALSLWASNEPLRWRYPNTAIDIVEVTDGDGQGQFLFSAAAVRRVANDYAAAADFPYRLVQSGTIELQYRSPELSPGFYDHYVSSPGDLIPGASALALLVSTLPDWLKVLYGGQTLWQWIGLLLSTLAGVIATYVIFRVFRRVVPRRRVIGAWLSALPPVLVAITVYGLGLFIDESINITGAVLTFVAGTTTTIILALVAWSAYRLCQAAAATVIAMGAIRDGTSDATMLRIISRVLGFLLAAGILLWGVRHLGADLIPLLAGLGVGGLAIALAAQRTFANLIGSLILFVNKPVRVGDFCRYGDQTGTVESIGLISTRIRSLERTVVTVPNAEFSEIKLDNFAARDQRLLSTVLQLRYETTPEQMRYVLAMLREMLLGHPKVTPEPARVRFSNFGAYSKDLEVFAYLRCQDQDAFCAIREDIFLRIDEIVADSGTGFAFPSQTAYLARDSGLDAAKAGDVARRVDEWRVRGKLPFPEFEEEERERLEDILDYPPKGSPHHQSGV